MSNSPHVVANGRSSGGKPAHVERFVLQIHSASFPADPEEDTGRGTPYSQGALRLLDFAANLGFNAIQLGPLGMTDRGNPSPYDATIFSRNPLDLPLKRYADSGRISPSTWKRIRSSLEFQADNTVPYPLVYDAFQMAIAEVIATASDQDRSASAVFLTEHQVWLEPDALYQVLNREHGSTNWTEWSLGAQGRFDQRLFAPLPDQRQQAEQRLGELKHKHRPAIEDYALIQWLLAEESKLFREQLRRRGLSVYGDLQVGLSLRDLWAWQGLFLEDYRIGAPPSRTNPSGQPWGYPVLDPSQYGTAEHPGPALRFVRARIQRLLGECDGVRIDHPHGWIDPWIYQTDDPDSLHAVHNGARLFSSPREPQHPGLEKFAIARPEQIETTEPMYGDRRVATLDADQVRQYSVLIDEIVRQLQRTGQPAESIACEVLSTLPYPVQRVIESYGIGRFRVTQKLNLNDASDVYRIEQAQPEDWIMLGTHDTPPIWRLAEQWCRDQTAVAWAAYLSRQLPAISGSNEEIAESPGRVVNSLFAALLASRARNVVVFFPDLFGMTGRYNEPGVISDRNWSLRIPADFETRYAADVKHGRALAVTACCAVAQQARTE